MVASFASLAEQEQHEHALFCHGSPVSDVRSFLPDPTPGEDELLGGTAARRIVFGHTHLPFIRSGPKGIELCNPGSVGMPFDGNPRAAYALMDDEGRIEHRRVRYDHASAARTVRERFPDWGEVVARRIEAARFEG